MSHPSLAAPAPRNAVVVRLWNAKLIPTGPLVIAPSRNPAHCSHGTPLPCGQPAPQTNPLCGTRVSVIVVRLPNDFRPAGGASTPQAVPPTRRASRATFQKSKSNRILVSGHEIVTKLRSLLGTPFALSVGIHGLTECHASLKHLPATPWMPKKNHPHVQNTTISGPFVTMPTLRKRPCSRCP
jgi:hypothetical protein